MRYGRRKFRRASARPRVVALASILLLLLLPILFVFRGEEREILRQRSVPNDKRRSNGCETRCPECDDSILGKFDIVFTWVNGTDPEFIRALKENGVKDVNFELPRFRDYNTLKYALRSIEQFVPFYGKVFILTNGQIPNWLNTDHDRIQIVTHDEIFVEEATRPTFSSRVIESHLHRIPNLNERFIYCNDDMMFGRAMRKSDFWLDGDVTVLYYDDTTCPSPNERNVDGIWMQSLQYTNKKLSEWLKGDHGEIVVNPTDEELERKRRPLAGHHCYNFRRSVLAEMGEALSVEYAKTRAKKHRESSDMCIPFLHNAFFPLTGRSHKEITSSQGEDFIYISFSNDDPSALRKDLQIINERRPKFLCFNDDFYEDPVAEVQDLMDTFFEEYYPLKSQYEF